MPVRVPLGRQLGPLAAGAAQRRGLYRAGRRAFLGDGQARNWTLQETHFPDFVPIADFVHPLGYVYEAAMVLAIAARVYQSRRR